MSVLHKNESIIVTNYEIRCQCMVQYKIRFRMQIIFYQLKFDVTSVLLLSRTGNSYAQFCQATNGRPNVQCPRGFNHISELDELECSHYLKQINNFQFSVFI